MSDSQETFLLGCFIFSTFNIEFRLSPLRLRFADTTKYFLHSRLLGWLGLTQPFGILDEPG